MVFANEPARLADDILIEDDPESTRIYGLTEARPSSVLVAHPQQTDGRTLARIPLRRRRATVLPPRPPLPDNAPALLPPRPALYDARDDA